MGDSGVGDRDATPERPRSRQLKFCSTFTDSAGNTTNNCPSPEREKERKRERERGKKAGASAT